MNRILAAVVVVLSVAVGPCTAWAQSDNSASRVKLARELLSLTQVDKLFNNVLPVIMRQERLVIKKLRPDISQKALARFEELFLAEARSDITILMDEVAEVYAGLLTEPELQEVTKFYRTPIGQKLIRIQPEVTAQSMRIGGRWGQSAGRKIAERVRQQLKKEGHKI